jgi:integrase/recombinase XerD
MKKEDPKEEREKGYRNIRRLRTRAQRGKAKGGRPDNKPDAQGDGLELAAERDAYLGWLQGRNLAAETIDHRRGDLELFFAWAAERDLTTPQQITLAILEAYQRHVSQYRKQNGKPLANRTQRKRLSTVQDYFRYLVRHGILQANPASELVLPKKESRLPEQSLTLAQIDDVLNVPDIADSLGIRDRAMLEVLYATAIRRSELARLETQDLNREAATLRVRLGKGKKDRIVPIGARALHWCERYIEEVRPRLQIDHAVGTLFLTGYGEGFHPNALGYLIGKYLRGGGVEKGGAHIIRHTCAQHLLEGGADIRYIQKLLGHASLETTAIYTEMSVEALRRVYSACHPAETRWKEKGR